MISVSEAGKKASPVMPESRGFIMLFLNVLSMLSGWIVLQTIVTYFGTIHLTKAQEGSIS